MGKKASSIEILAPASVADALFTPVQQRVLGILFSEPDRAFQSAPLIRRAGAGTGATHRVLKRLTECGLVRATVDGRQKYYQANAASPVYSEMLGLVRKTLGVPAVLRESLAPLSGKIRAAFVYGSVAGGNAGNESDIDLMVIADRMSYTELYDVLQPLEASLGRSIHANLLTRAEWRRRSRRSGSFAAAVRNRPRLFILGSDGDLEQA
jgi:predicted nucleotidyltransferase